MIDYEALRSVRSDRTGTGSTRSSGGWSAGGARPMISSGRTPSSTELGELVGTRIARNADIVDAHPPQLVRYDRWANEVDEVEHHPAMLDSKRAMWECGYVSGFAADEARARSHDTRRRRSPPRTTSCRRPTPDWCAAWA